MSQENIQHTRTEEQQNKHTQGKHTHEKDTREQTNIFKQKTTTYIYKRNIQKKQTKMKRQ